MNSLLRSAGFLAVCVGVFCMPGLAQDKVAMAGKGKTVYVLPIQGEIERGLTYQVRRGLREAADVGADVIVLDMDTPGGRLDATKDIVNLLTAQKARTICFVNTDAISAGAIISFATDDIYMAPNGRIGDAMPVMASPMPMGGVEAIPDALREKAMSPTEAMIRALAQQKGHDAELAACMVRPELEYKIGEKVLDDADRILTLTSQEAAQRVGDGDPQRPLLSKGTVADLDALLKAAGLEGANVVRMESSMTEGLGRYVDNVFISGVLLGLGLLAVYIEIKTPGFGFPGIAGIALLLLWFWGHHLAGLAGTGEVILFAVGVVCLVVEILFIPGFGVLGFAGLIMIIASIFMAMVKHMAGGSPLDVPPEDIRRAVQTLAVMMLTLVPCIYFVVRLFPKTAAYEHLVLATDMKGGDGFVSSAAVGVSWVGRKGVADTALKPTGIGVFGNDRMNVLTDGEFIEKDTSIVVAKTQGNRMVVRALNRKT